MIKTPNVNTSLNEKEKSETRYRRKPLPDPEDLERYADVILTYRQLLKLSALAEDIGVGPQRRYRVPQEREELLKWVSKMENLDLVAESFRRTCSGYVTSERLFAINHGPFTRDWPAIISIVRTAETDLKNSAAFVEISGRGRLYPQVEKLTEALNIVRDVIAQLEDLQSKKELPGLPPRRSPPTS